eukprot:2453111-Amphidinium_carterae.1
MKIQLLSSRCLSNCHIDSVAVVWGRSPSLSDQQVLSLIDCLSQVNHSQEDYWSPVRANSLSFRYGVFFDIKYLVVSFSDSVQGVIILVDVARMPLAFWCPFTVAVHDFLSRKKADFSEQVGIDFAGIQSGYTRQMDQCKSPLALCSGPFGSPCGTVARC